MDRAIIDQWEKLLQDALLLIPDDSPSPKVLISEVLAQIGSIDDVVPVACTHPDKKNVTAMGDTRRRYYCALCGQFVDGEPFIIEKPLVQEEENVDSHN